MRLVDSTLLAALVVAATAAAGVLAQGPSLNLPQQWVSEQTNSIVINQGGEPSAGGAICCPAEAPECKVQTGFSAGKQYFDLPNNRTAFKNPDNSGVVTLFNLGKEFAVDSDGNCQSYCPAPHHMFPFALLGPNATDEGTVTYNGVSCNDFRTYTRIIFNITMQQTDTYAILGTGGATDTPVGQVQLIEPFGLPMGKQTMNWKSFQAGPSTVPDSAFTVNGIDNCPINSQCQGGGGGSSSSSSSGSPSSHSGSGSPSSSSSSGFPFPSSSSSSSSSSPRGFDVADLEGFHGRSLEEKLDIIHSLFVPAGYSEPSYLWPRPAAQ